MKYDEAGVYEVPLSATDECSNETVRNREVLVAREIIAGDNVSLEQEGNEVTINVDVCGALDECQTIIDMKDDIDGKQDELTAGQNITIENNVISSDGTTYTAGDNITIENDVISATDTTYTAGDNITIENNVISADEVDLSDYYTKSQTYSKTEVDNLLDDKQDKLTAGQNIQIAQDGTISATDTTYEPATQQANGLMSSADKTKLDGMTPEDYLTCANVLDCQSVSDALDAKQDELTAGDNISITQDNTISADIDPATDTTYGTIKLNPNEGIRLNQDGQLEIDVPYQWGETEDGGLFYPPTLEPVKVAKNSILVSEATNMTVHTNRNFAIIGGTNVNLKVTAQAGATTFEVSNTFVNRFTCACARNGYATIEQATAGDLIVNVTAVYLANDPDKTPLVPYSGAAESGNNIIIETDAPLSDTETLKKLRLYGTMTFDTTFQCGMGVGTGGVTGKGKLLQLGQNQLALEGNSCIVGNGMFTSMNRVFLCGANHINWVLGACMTGEGHDSVNGTKIGLTAHGVYSEIYDNTVFVLGNGTNNTTRSNIFEVTDDNGATGVIMKSPSGYEFKLTVDDNGNLSTTQVIRQ